jgi:hypothetical protein
MLGSDYGDVESACWVPCYPEPAWTVAGLAGSMDALRMVALRVVDTRGVRAIHVAVVAPHLLASRTASNPFCACRRFSA